MCWHAQNLSARLGVPQDWRRHENSQQSVGRFK
jgi:hypothetical protein